MVSSVRYQVRLNDLELLETAHTDCHATLIQAPRLDLAEHGRVAVNSGPLGGFLPVAQAEALTDRESGGG
jgi:hypothetical protein